MDEEINNPDNYNVARYSIEYRLSLQHADGTKEHFSQNNIRAWHKDILQETDFDALYNSEEEARGDAENFKNYIKKDTDEVIGESITVTLQPQISPCPDGSGYRRSESYPAAAVVQKQQT